MAHPSDGQESEQYHPKDAVGETLKSLLITGGAGMFISAVQNSLQRQNVGAFAFLSRTGGTVATYTAMGAAYGFVKNASANLREKDDTWNVTYAGFATGAVLGLRARSVPAIFGYGTTLAVVLSAFTFTGGKLSGFTRDTDVDEVSRKEFLRKNRRRPIEETISEIGEGRGICPPGYDERRAQRLKDRYGFDVPVATRS